MISLACGVGVAGAFDEQGESNQCGDDGGD
jgi:hypothetical protein